jgi:regulator of nucleoside diphosphate kinase
VKTTQRNICITRADAERLQRVVSARRGPRGRDEAHLDALEEELERAEVVDAGSMPPDVVTMHSRVRVRDMESGKEAEYTLSFPSEADLDQGRLSVLAPIGTALLGYREGDQIEWPVPAGIRRLEVTQVLFQPEAAATSAGRERRSLPTDLMEV